MANKKRQPRRGTTRRKRSHWVKSLIDSYSLTIALLVELAITMISFWIIAPDTLTGIGFVAIASIVVLFAVRSWMKALTTFGVEKLVGHSLWASFALVALFFNLSFALATTETQTVQQEVRITLEDDRVLERLDQRLAEARVNRDTLNEQYNDAVRETTVASLLSQMDRAEEQISRLEAQVNEREQQIITGEASEQAQREALQLTAQRIFYAIPTAVEKGRWIEILVFFFIFLGLELTIVMAVTEQVPSKRKTSKAVESAHTRALRKQLNALQEEVRARHEKEKEQAPAPRVQQPKRRKSQSRPKPSASNTAEEERDTSSTTRIPDAPEEPVESSATRRTSPKQERFRDTVDLFHRNPSNDVPSTANRQNRSSVARALLSEFLNELAEVKYQESFEVVTDVVLSKTHIRELLHQADMHLGPAQTFLKKVGEQLFERRGPTGYPLLSMQKTGKVVPNYTPEVIRDTLVGLIIK